MSSVRVILVILPIFLSFNFSFVNSSNILCLYPRPAYSHQNVFRAITEKLLERGHKVTLLSTHPSESEKNHENVTLIDASFSALRFHQAMDDIFTRRVTGFKKAIFHIIDVESDVIDTQLNAKEFQKILKMTKSPFDVIILETAGFSPYHALAEKFQIPLIGVSSADTFSTVHEVMGNPANPIAHPDRVIPFTIAKTFLQRLGSCFLNLFMEFVILPYSAEKYEKLLDKHFPDIEKSHTELVNNIQLLMINAHPALGFVRPILANTIQLGFLHIKPPKPLPNDLQNLLDNSSNGAIYMSFGTIVSNLQFENNFKNFLQAFAHVDYEIFWKYDGADLDNVPKNVHIQKWFPQSDLLAHKNVKLFITHGGLHSIEESILRRVPMIVCPFHGDQSGNADRIVTKGIAEILNIHQQLNSSDIIELVQKVVNDEKYEKNVIKLAKIVEDVPMTSAEKAAWHIEFVIRHGGAEHLKYPQKHIPFYQYHYWDVIAFVVTISLFVIFTVLIIFIKLFKCLCQQTLVEIREDRSAESSEKIDKKFK